MMASIDCKDLTEDAATGANLLDFMVKFSSKEYQKKERKRVAESYRLLNKQVDDCIKRGIKPVIIWW